MIRELGPEDTVRAVPALLVLRPHLDAPALLAQVERQRSQGYRLLGAFAEGDEDAAAVAGFRAVEMLAWGRGLYVDDLVCRPEHRGAGHAGALLRAIDSEAVRLGCGEVHLDSGIRPERHDAHRLYLNHRMAIESFHFVKRVG